MADYHKFVFDPEARRLVGEFEAMYAAEDREGFDSWRSHDARHLRLQLTLALLAEYNFGTILEIGCGKGIAAQFLKKQNNRVVGIDISPTAIKKAKASFPDIEFHCLDASRIGELGDTFDLVTVQAVLAYIPQWRDVLTNIARMTDYCLVAEYIPPGPIGMVKSSSELVEAFKVSFDIQHKILLDEDVTILLGRRKSTP